MNNRIAEPDSTLVLPVSERCIRTIRAGTFLQLTGTIYTARDAVHRYLAAGHKPPCNLEGAFIYHCGPIAVKRKDTWDITAAGPTTSMREEQYMPALIKQYGIRGIIGKGGMGKETLDACQTVGCIYCHAVGGAAQVLANHITSVQNVYLDKEFGLPEAVWELNVASLPVIVTMDSNGANLHQTVETRSEKVLKSLLKQQASHTSSPYRETG
ncbi:MAG: FumA C-terminus/TtdB family hydratase beta subunit [Candidatus Pacebacteria bacterium]|nr:FumA C-terminus/TtdB family hydratase beta subunit [Candidatus Paceibacterota bacterium]